MRIELAEMADRYWDQVLAAWPSLATLLGDHRFDDRIEDLSLDAEQAQQAEFLALGERVTALEEARLSPVERTTRSLLLGELDRSVAHLEWRPTEMAWDQSEGVHATLLTLVSQFNAPEPEHAYALTRRFGQIGVLLAQAVDRFRAGLSTGRTPARVTIERSLGQLDRYLAGPLVSDPFVTVVGPTGWDGEVAWREALSQLARETIRPAMRRYRDAMATELLPAARSDDQPGLCWLGDDGMDIYQRSLRRHTTLDSPDPDAIFGSGMAQIERLGDEYAQIGERLFGTTDFDEVVRRLREDPQLRYSDGRQILADTRRCVEAATVRADQWFRRRPRGCCDVVAVPDTLAADTPAAYYYPPAADGTRPGTYFVNLDQPGDRGRFETAAVAFHEAIPGHHLQLGLALELDHLPRFQRESWANTAFVEGWGLYAERLADEMGLYADDFERLGMLTCDSLRSARLVVDTGLHARGWSRERAVEFMTAVVPVGLNEISVEVDRYIATPGQAVAYKLGQLEILGQRAAATARLGKNFDIRSFHDRILGSGSISLPVLRQLASTLGPPPVGDRSAVT